MQKIYERIEWENEPSTKTPLNEDNLNKMDYALDQIDTRIVELSGYQEAAAASATAAKTSEDNAKDSEIVARLSVTSADLSAFNAATSATNAHTSEVNAANSATNAANSATNAATSASNAAISATSANLSAFNASVSEANALTYKNNAETSKDRAILAETNSHGSEVNASMSATSAALSAFNAGVSESDAANSALLSKSWAVGKTGVRPDENSNNAQYWAERAQAVTRVTIDNVFSSTSLNPVENRVITNQHVNKSIAQEDGVHGLRYYDEVLQLYNEVEHIWEDITSGGGGGVPLDPPTNISLTNQDEAVLIRWTDPNDVIIDGTTLAAWDGTVVVRKAGSAPTKKSDGTIVIDSKVKNQYQSTGFLDTGLTNGVQYYYGIFPYTTGKIYTLSAVEDITPQAILPTAINDLDVVAYDECADIEFTKPADATTVRIVYKSGSTPSSDTDGSYVDGVTSPYTLQNLVNNTQYHFVAYTYNAKGRKAASNEEIATPQIIYPDAVSSFNVTAGNASATVTFTL